MDECDRAFKNLKYVLTSAAILTYPEPKKYFFLDTDLSKESVGAFLSEDVNGQERVIIYWSKYLSKPDQKLLCHQKLITRNS